MSDHDDATAVAEPTATMRYERAAAQVQRLHERLQVLQTKSPFERTDDEFREIKESRAKLEEMEPLLPSLEAAKNAERLPVHMEAVNQAYEPLRHEQVADLAQLVDLLQHVDRVKARINARFVTQAATFELMEDRQAQAYITNTFWRDDNSQMQQIEMNIAQARAEGKALTVERISVEIKGVQPIPPRVVENVRNGSLGVPREHRGEAA